MNRFLSQVNLKRYLPFFSFRPSDDYMLAVFNQYGTPQVFEYNESSGPVKKVFEKTSNQTFDWDKVDPVQTVYAIGKNGLLQVAPMTLGANERGYWLAVIQYLSSPVSPKQQARHQQTLKHVAACVQEDYTQVEIINGMSEELTIRYEELNLLYGMDDTDSICKNRDEHASLEQIINNCVEYLNIDLAILYFPEMEVKLYEAGAGQVPYHDQLISSIIEKIYPFVFDNPETLVVNRDSDTDWTDAGLIVPCKLIASPIVKSDQLISGILVLINDITKADFSNSDRKLAEIMSAEASKLTQARRDGITGQLNRRGFTEKLNDQLSGATAYSEPNILFLINIDQFKVINDTSGQVGGDQLLRQINSLIKKNLKADDVLGRLGADEFAVILKRCSLSDGVGIADRIRTVIKQFRFFYQDKLFDISACVGVVELTPDITDFSTALRAADLACSVAKNEGRNRTHVYKKDDEELVLHENQMQWVSRINIGLEENRFQIFRQMILPLQASQVKEIPHYEILLRLRDSDGSILAPFHFLPAAERYSMMPKLDRWVIETTLIKMAEINNTQPQNSISCSINLSGQSVCEDHFSAFVIEQIRKYRVPPQHVCFEITETAAVTNLTKAVEFIEKVKRIGCVFSLDDFGSGMSSFTYLKNLPVNYLKIDGYFVKTLLENEIDRAMVASIHQIGSVMGLKTIAEFVENDAILAELRNMGIDYGQGYGIGKPEPF